MALRPGWAQGHVTYVRYVIRNCAQAYFDIKCQYRLLSTSFLSREEQVLIENGSKQNSDFVGDSGDLLLDRFQPGPRLIIKIIILTVFFFSPSTVLATTFILGLAIKLAVFIVGDLLLYLFTNSNTIFDQILLFTPLFGLQSRNRSGAGIVADARLSALGGPVSLLCLATISFAVFHYMRIPVMLAVAQALSYLSLIYLIPVSSLNGDMFLFYSCYIRSMSHEIVGRSFSIIVIALIGLFLGGSIVSVVLALWAGSYIPFSIISSNLVTKIGPIYKLRISGSIYRADKDLLQRFIADVDKVSRYRLNVLILKNTWNKILAKTPSKSSSIIALLIYLVLAVLGVVFANVLRHIKVA
jgi:hypothetical protein